MTAVPEGGAERKTARSGAGGVAAAAAELRSELEARERSRPHARVARVSERAAAPVYAQRRATTANLSIG